MKRICRNALRILLVTVMMILGIAVNTMAKDPLPDYTSYKAYYSPTVEGYSPNFPAGVKFSNLRTSNSKVAKPVKTYTGKYGGRDETVDIDYRGPGKATIRFTAKRGNETKRYKIKVTLLEWKNPFRNFKIGSRSYLRYYAASDFYDPEGEGTVFRGNLNVRVKSGFEIKDISIMTRKNTDTPYKYEYKFRKVKNNTNIRVRSNEELRIKIYSKKDDFTTTVVLRDH